jgi:NAD(P)-dependent dehydrogenase (short-subunit alcohol dehydrogenase family)
VIGNADNECVAASLTDKCLNAFGRLDALINCAGIAEPHGSSILTILPEEFDEQIGANLGTAFHTCRVASSIMAEQRHGTIINTGSVTFLGNYGGTGYPAAKAAINGLTMAVAAELKADGVRANVICPAARTRLSTGTDYELQIADLYRRGLIDAMATRAALDAPPAEFVAPLYAYLVSDMGADVTGQIFVATGGFVGCFNRPDPRLLINRDHQEAGPWSVEDLHKVIRANAAAT